LTELEEFIYHRCPTGRRAQSISFQRLFGVIWRGVLFGSGARFQRAPVRLPAAYVFNEVFDLKPTSRISPRNTRMDANKWQGEFGAVRFGLCVLDVSVATRLAICE